MMDVARSVVRRSRMLPVLSALVAVVASGCGSLVPASDDEFGRSSDPAEVDVEAVARAAIDAREMRRRIAFLSSDALREQSTVSTGLERAAAWIGEAYYASGLEQAGDDGGYVQFWPWDVGDTTIAAPNLVGVLPGAEVGRSQEHVIVTAHLDLMADGTDGAASGVAALLGVADAFAALPARAARPVLFLVTSGGDRGSAGASWFADHAPVFLSHAVAVISLHQVGGRGDEVVAVGGHEYSTLGPLLERVAEEGLDPRLELTPAGADLFRSSGLYPLARRGIPAVVVSSAPVARSGAASDGAEESDVDPERVARVARLAFLAAYQVATMEGRPEWTPRGRRAVSP